MTTAIIAAVLPDGKIKSILVNADGYPDHTGKMLYRYYHNVSKILELLDLGNLSFLGKYVESPPPDVDNRYLYTIAYSRDFQESYEDNKPHCVNNVDELIKDRHGDYRYLYHRGSWLIYDKKNSAWNILDEDSFNNHIKSDDDGLI